MGSIGCLETSVRNYHYSLRNSLAARSYLRISQLSVHLPFPSVMGGSCDAQLPNNTILFHFTLRITMPMTRRRGEGKRGPRFVCLVSVCPVTVLNYFLKAASSVCIMALSVQIVRPSAAACGRHSLEQFPAANTSSRPTGMYPALLESGTNT
jgi:hypothetical protein